jgi:hypothetical protein
LALAVALATALLPAAAARATVLEGFDVQFHSAPPKGSPPGALGPPALQAGSHPYAMTTSFEVQTTEVPGGFVLPAEALKDSRIAQVPGFAGTPSAAKHCQTVEFLASVLAPIPGEGELLRPACPESTVIGVAEAEVGLGGQVAPLASPVYNMPPAPGAAARLGLRFSEVPVMVDIGLSESSPYRIVAGTSNTPQTLEVNAFALTLWGVPADKRHDALRGHCLRLIGGPSGLSCPTGAPERPFLTSPRACRGPLATSWSANSWQRPDHFDTGSVLTHDEGGAPRGFGFCGRLGFAPEIEAEPTTAAAQSPTGLEFSLEVDDENLTSAAEEAVANSDIERTVVTLPEGMSLNPSQAEGLEVCTEAQLEAESPFSAPGEGPDYTPPGAGCPDASKIGQIEVETPLLPGELLRGSLFVAAPYDNLADDSLIAVYVVIKDPELGIVVKQALRVEPDPRTGQLVTTAEDMPQLPFSAFRLRFREGARAPLISPPGCGTFETTAKLYPHSGGPAVTSTSAFEIVSGPDNGPCPRGTAPFDPGFEAGTLNNQAGSYSPFVMRISRRDGEQDLTKLSQVLPPGVVGKIAGVPWCPEAGIARARARTGERGGTAELADPSCPAASQIGRSEAGAGVGSQLTYVPGKLYLAGPYNGDPLSVVSITPAVAGPFDAGAVVVRFALTLDPITGEVELDGAASDPIPHILQGIPLNVRDLRAYVDRPNFTLNATSCREERTLATLWGGGTVLDPAFETPVVKAARYQAAGCRALGFKPRIGLKLKGKPRRGGFPALRAHYRPRSADANLRRLALTFPSSAFIEQGHFRTICTRVAFAAGPGHGALCPKGSVYGRARVWSPLLSEPLTGPVILRSSDHNLPDAVLALRGPPEAAIEIEVAVRIDSVNGRLRATVERAPDAPVSRAIVDMQGGQKGLIVNSRHLCHKPKRNRAWVNAKGQNGRKSVAKPLMRALGCLKRYRKVVLRDPGRAGAPRHRHGGGR